MSRRFVVRLVCVAIIGLAAAALPERASAHEVCEAGGGGACTIQGASGGQCAVICNAEGSYSCCNSDPLECYCVFPQ
jgi:hypothetical protein